jgi:hypothetical protein
MDDLLELVGDGAVDCLGERIRLSRHGGVAVLIAFGLVAISVELWIGHRFRLAASPDWAFNLVVYAVVYAIAGAVVSGARLVLGTSHPLLTATALVLNAAAVVLPAGMG